MTSHDLAVFVGVGEYEDRDIQNLPEIAEEIDLVTGALRRNGFTTRPPLQGTVTREAVRQYLAEAAAEEPRRLVIYWTGHGVSDTGGGRLLLTPAGAVLRAAELATLLTSAGVPQTVVVLDCCDAGSTALDVVNAINAAPRAVPDPGRVPAALTLIASSFGNARVSPVLFAEAFTTALRNGPPFGPWPAQTARIPPQDLALAADAWLRRDGAPAGQRVFAVGVDAGTPIFRNPAYRPGLREIVTDGESRVRRGLVLDDLFAWRASRPAGLYLLTGSIGTGKTETLAQAVAELAETPSAERLVHADLGLQRTVASLIEVLAPRLGGATSPEALVDAVRAAKRPLTVVLDALDEAGELPEIVSRIVLPLAASPRTHVVVALRNTAAGAIEEVLRERCSSSFDLDRDPQAKEAIARHVTNVLTGTPESPYASSPALAGVVASEMAAASDGAFLFATSLANALARDVEPLRPGDPELRRRLGQSTAEAIEDELRHRFGGRASTVAAVLAPLAWAAGTGLPAGPLWARMVQAVGLLPAADPPDGDLADSDAIGQVVVEAGAFLGAVEEDGRRVYRLRHAAYGDYLRVTTPGEPAALHRRILEAIQPTLGGWASADLYVRRYAASHAADAEALGELFADPDVPLYAEPRTTLAAIHRVPSGTWSGAVTGYLMAGARLYGLTPAERILALQAVPGWRRTVGTGGGRRDTPARPPLLPSVAAPGRIEWTTVGSPAVHHTLYAAGDTLDAMTTIPSDVSGGRRLIAVAASTRFLARQTPAVIHLVDVDTAAVIQELGVAHTAKVVSMACLASADPLLVAGYANGVVAAWSVRERRIRWMHDTASQALSITPIQTGQGILLGVADTVSELLLLRGTDGAMVRAIRNRGGIICTTGLAAGGRTVLCTSTNTGWLEFWDAETFAELNAIELEEPWTKMVTVTVAGRPLLVGARTDGRLELLDGRTWQKITVTRQETGGEITDMCVLDAAAPYPVIATAHGRQITAWSWSATTFTRQSVLHGHTSHITSLASFPGGADHDVVVSAAADGTARLWPSIGGMGSHQNQPDHDERSYGKIYTGTVRGHRVVVASERRQADILDARNGVQERSIPDEFDDTHLEIIGGRPYASLSIGPDQAVYRLHGLRLDALAETANETYLLTNDQGGDRLWGLSDGRLYGAPPRPENARSVAVGTGHPVLFSAGDDGTGQVRAADFYGRDLGEVPGSAGGTPVLAAHGGHGPALLLRWPDRVAWYDIGTGSWLHTFPLSPVAPPWQVLAATELPNGTATVAVSNVDAGTHIVRSDGAETVGLPLPSPAGAIFGSLFALAQGDLVVLVRPDDGEVVRRLPLPGPIDDIAFLDEERLTALVGDCVMTILIGDEH
ncbi:hypothetical protein AB0I95_21755 [Micromonospora sp. NPDC049751]|uniref:hypothetical protein n=1 Tax=Micromonospora sp. NPDC049751 TaxID=3154837 RepID=UPI0033C6F97E